MCEIIKNREIFRTYIGSLRREFDWLRSSFWRERGIFHEFFRPRSWLAPIVPQSRWPRFLKTSSEINQAKKLPTACKNLHRPGRTRLKACAIRESNYSDRNLTFGKWHLIVEAPEINGLQGLTCVTDSTFFDFKTHSIICLNQQNIRTYSIF